MIRNRPVALAALLSIALLACDPTTDTDETPAASGPLTTLAPDASAVALQKLLGPWRPTALPLDATAIDPVRSACVAAADPVLSFGLADQPVVVADARGLGLVSVVLADEFAAFECRATLSADAASATAIEPPAPLDPSSVAPLDESNMSVVALTRVDDPAGSRTLLIGRVGPSAFTASVTFNDETEVVAAKDHGWFLAWWPGSKEPGGILSASSRSIVQEDVPDPATIIEGRVTPAAWWIDSTAPPPESTSTRIDGVLRERSCAGRASPEGRVLAPTIFSSEEAVLVTYLVRRLPGAQDCQVTEPFPVSFDLPEALGDRRLLDGSEIPPRDASTAVP